MTAGSAEGPLRILIVEDEQTNRLLLRAVLRRAPEPRLSGAAIIEAGSLTAARSALSRGAVDVVILDVRLPDGSGLELARELMQDARPGRPLLLVMSASVLPAERDAALAAGSDAFVGKPFIASELFDAFERLLGSG